MSAVELNEIPDIVMSSPQSVCSYIAQPLFFITVLIGTTLTGIALFTPGWFQMHFSKTGTSNYGIIVQSRDDWWTDQANWEKAVIVLMVLAFAIEIIIVIWAMFSFIPICIPSLFIPVPFLTGITAILLVISVTLFSVNIQKEIDILTTPSLSFENTNTEKNKTLSVNVIYSFWVAVVAMSVMIFSSFFGCITAAVSPTF